MARPREFDKDDVIQKMEAVFWEKGYEATTMADLAEVAGMQRGSLYNAFGDKRQLYLEVLRHYGEREYQEAAERLRQVARDQGAKTAVYHLYESHADKMSAGQDSRGCLLCSACSERAAQDIEAKKLVEHYIGVLQTAIADSLEQDPNLALNRDKANALATSFTATYIGFRIWSKAGLSTEMIRQSTAAALGVLER